jgi:hypothetical protein
MLCPANGSGRSLILSEVMLLVAGRAVAFMNSCEDYSIKSHLAKCLNMAK